MSLHLWILISLLAGSLSKAILEPSGALLETYSWPATPHQPISHASIILYEGDFHCTHQEFPVVSGEPPVLVVIGDILCYPSDLGERALILGYAGVLVVYDSTFLELSRINYWDRRGGGVSSYRSRDFLGNWSSIQSISIDDSEPINYFKTNVFFYQLWIFTIPSAILCAWKARRALWVLKSYWTDGLRLNHGITILIIEFCQSTVTLLYLVDPLGVRGLYSWPTITLLTRLFLNLSLSTTVIAWDGILIIGEASGLIPSTRCNRLLHRICKTFVSMYMILEIVITVRYFSKTETTMILAIEILLNAIIVSYLSYSLLDKKRRMIKTLSSNNSNSRHKLYERRVHYLSISAVFMICGLVISLMSSISAVFNTSPLLAWYCFNFCGVCQTLVGCYQVLSVPYKIVGRPTHA